MSTLLTILHGVLRNPIIFYELNRDEWLDYQFIISVYFIEIYEESALEERKQNTL